MSHTITNAMEVMSAAEMEGVLPLGPPSRCTYPAVLCCVCGCRMQSPSPQRSTCLACLAQQTDITEGISRNVVLPCCSTCGRYMHTQNRWLPCELESRELMALMLQKIRGLKKVAKVLDSNWVWREPHSRRVTLKLTVQKEILDGRASVQQALLVEGIIQTTQCDDCKKSFTPHAGWTAMVQVRQHADHKRTLLFLEQLVLKHQLMSRLLNVVEKPDGLDFWFPSRQTALQFSAFCESRFPCLLKQSKQLISHDASSNTYFHKYTISVTLAPLCRDDLVYVHRKQWHAQLARLPSLALCSRVAGAGVQLLDPFTGRTAHVSVERYWRTPFPPLCTRKHLSSFLVLDVNLADPPYRGSTAQQTTEGALQQQRQVPAGGGASRRRRRRRHMLTGGLAAETRDVCWKGEREGGKNRREGRAVAARRKRQLEGFSTERRPSVNSGESFASDYDRSSASGCGAPSDDCPSHTSTYSTTRGMEAAAGPESMRAEVTSDAQLKHRAPRTKTAAACQIAPQQNRILQVYDVELMRDCDVGVCDRRVITRTHLGEVLQPGDWVQGYDLRSINLAGAVDCELDEDAAVSAAGGKQRARRTQRPGGQRAARSTDEVGERKTSDSREDMAIDGGTDSCVREGLETSSTVNNAGDQSDDDVDAYLRGTNGGDHDETDEENPLLRCVRYEVIIVKKQPLGSLCAAAERAAADGKGSNSFKKALQSGCKVRPWVLQTLQKERDTAQQRRKRGQGGGAGGKKGVGRTEYEDDDSDAEMEAFKDELEEDSEMRAQVNLWRDPRYSKNKTAGQSAKKKAEQRRARSARRTARAASANEGGQGVKENDERGAGAGDETQNGDGDAGAWEDCDSDEQSNDGETGVKLAELLEGLTLENGELKGVVVQPGGPEAAAVCEPTDAKSEGPELAKVEQKNR